MLLSSSPSSSGRWLNSGFLGKASRLLRDSGVEAEVVNRAVGELRLGGGRERPGMIASKEEMGGTPAPKDGLA